MSREPKPVPTTQDPVPPGADPLWSKLELPPPAPAPPGFAGRVLARARAEERSRLGLPLSPAWARAAAALALVAGIAGGAGLGWVASEPVASEPATEAVAWTSTSTLAEEDVDFAGTLDPDVTAATEEAR